MGGELPIDFERAPVTLLPGFEYAEQLLALFGTDRVACASAH